jgi:hypothetical protein
VRFSNALHCGGQELEVRRGVVGEQLAGPVGLGGEVADPKVFGSSISVGTLRLAADGTLAVVEGVCKPQGESAADVRVWLTNNAAKRALRRERGAERAAVMHTLIRTAKLKVERNRPALLQGHAGEADHAHEFINHVQSSQSSPSFGSLGPSMKRKKAYKPTTMVRMMAAAIIMALS